MPALPTRLPGPVSDLFDRADRVLISGWYHAVSIEPERFRAWLRRRRMPFLDPAPESTIPASPPPPLAEVDRTAELVIDRASHLFGAVGGAAGLVGAATIPPEIAAAVVSGLRLSQRLCVVYGFDPSTDRGQVALCRALAAGYGVSLPQTGPMGMRMRDLPGLLLPTEAPSPARMGSRVAKAVAVNSAWWVAGRLSRLVPIVSASSHAWDNRRKVGATGREMMQVLRQLAESPAEGPIEEASEIP